MLGGQDAISKRLPRTFSTNELLEAEHGHKDLDKRTARKTSTGNPQLATMEVFNRGEDAGGQGGIIEKCFSRTAQAKP